MKVRLNGRDSQTFVSLSNVPYGAFAQGLDGKLYLAPGPEGWITPNREIHSGFERVKNSFEVTVVRLPAGTEVTLISEI
jgi:hypothetical protein